MAKMRGSKHFAAVLLAVGLAATGCGGGAAGEGGELNQVRLAMDNDDFMNQMTWMVADEKYWPKLGFDKPAKVVASDEYLAGLLGGDVWVAQGESDVIWAALAEGSVPLKMIGVIKDTESWWLGVRKGVDPNNLEGLKISGGPPGDRNNVVAQKILQGLNVNPDDMNFVAVEGGSDERLQALLAGQIDAAVLQPRHLNQLEDAGGQMIVKDFRELPQEVWVVKAETLENNRDAVCAYVEGRVAALQYAAEGEDHTANRDAIVKMVAGRGLEPSEDELAEWPEEMGRQLALDGGASLESFDEWNQDMINNGNVPEGFDWKEHADFSCLTEAQEKLGLEPNPGNL